MTPTEKVLATLPDAKRSGSGWRAKCPAHEDRRPSLSIAEGDGGRALVNCGAGCAVEDVVRAMGMTMADLMPERPGRPRCRAKAGSKARTFATAREVVAELERQHGRRSAMWTYTDAKGNPVGVVVRWDLPDGEKDIRPVARNGEGWRIGGMPAPRPLYHLPELADAERVFITEGEKAADAARTLGLVASTSAHGCKSAEKTDWTPLAGKEVVVLPDNDEAGRKYAEAVRAMLAGLTPAPRVKVVELPDLPPGGDIVEFIESRNGDSAAARREIEALVDAAPVVEARGAIFGRPVLRCLADVEPQEVRWLWPGRFALGKLALLAGDPGLGKSFVTLDMAARVSTGTPWPDAPSVYRTPGGVVLLSAEDDIADTIRPRLDAAQAAVSRIMALESVRRWDGEAGGEVAVPFCLTRDLPSLMAAIEQTPECRLVVIDPITAYLGKTDSHKNADMRGLLAPLSSLAAQHEVAIVAVTHLNKNAAGPAIYRSMGSLAFTAAARAVWAVTKDKDDPRRRLILPVKNNIAPDVMGLAYAIIQSDRPGVAMVAWEAEPVNLSADDALAAERGNGDERSDREQAADWLRDALADGPMHSTAVLTQAKENGITEKTLRRAFRGMGGKPFKGSFGGGWFWQLPGEDGHDEPEDAQDAHPKDVGNFGKSGHLGSDGDDWGEI